MKKNSTLTSLALLALSTVVSGLTAQAVQAVPQQVTYTALKGNYAFGSPANDEGIYPSAGTFTFDGKGHVSGVLSMNDNGTVCNGMTLIGTYTVNPGLASGSALMTLTSVSTGGCDNAGNNDSIPLVLAIANGGNVIYFAEMDDESTGYFSDNFAYLAGVATHY